MPVNEMTIKGFRGFSKEGSLRFAQPKEGKAGSGITILVGPNNGGKSTIVEAIQAWSRTYVSFSEGKLNQKAGSHVSIRISVPQVIHELKTVDAGGSETVRDPSNPPLNCYVLPSRRFFDPFFGQGEVDRQGYLQQRGIPSTRSTPVSEFSRRLFYAQNNRERFQEVLQKVVNPAPVWNIKLADHGQYFLDLDSDGLTHSSDGLGEGIVSLLFIVDALYDSKEGDLIVIDEPELSLHPAYQRRLANLLAEYAESRQVVYATHSPYFVDFNHVQNGAEIVRIHKLAEGCVISQLKRETAHELEALLRDTHNPHVLGLDAREVFFREEGVVIVEGQEDVVSYPKVLQSLVEGGNFSNEKASRLQESFFGWGAGGADKVDRIASLLSDLGFERVAGIVDNNKSEEIPKLKKRFPNFTFLSIPADDIRDKPASESRDATRGLLNGDGKLRPEYVEATSAVFNSIAECLCGNSSE